jgi:hypothetical protein
MMTHNTDGSTHYAIIIKGYLDLEWRDWFNDLDIIHSGDGNTSLSGMVADQAALYGILKQINNLGLTLISVNRIPCEGEES